MSKQTTNHDEIKKWAESQGMQPTAVAEETTGDVTGLLRFSEGAPDTGSKLHSVTWDHFFDLFEQNDLALVHEADSKFNKIVSR